MKLRVNGIYRLPNARELVVTAEKSENNLHSYTLENLDVGHPLLYLVSGEGRLLSDGKLTAWDFNDLHDTGRDALNELA